MKEKGRITGWVFLFGLMAMLITGCEAPSLLTKDFSADSSTIVRGEPEKNTTGSVEEHAKSAEIYVHVCGCVKQAGLYQVPSGTRAGEIIEQAGGFTKKADEAAINLAEILEDGMQIYVPEKSLQETAVSSADSGREVISPSADLETALPQININTASAEELMGLSGIGEARASDIVHYREENGSFSSIEEIKQVEGIGDGIFEKIKELITI